MFKNAIISFIAFVLCTCAAQAQPYINPQVGINISSFNYSFLAGSGLVAEASSGYQIGFVIRTGGSIYMEPGLFLMGTNQKYTVTDGNNFITTGIVGKTSLQLPLRVGLTTGGGEGLFNVRVAAGPVLGYNLDSNENAWGISGADFEDIDFGGKIGLGLDITFVTVDFDYQIGLNDVFKEGSPFGVSNFIEGGRSNLFMVTAGVKF